jgi:hypothetical protein
MCGGGGGDDGSEEARRREEERQARIRAGMTSINQTFSQFDDGFFDRRRDAYTAYAMPQLEDQYTNALTTLTSALARTGGLGSLRSSVAAKKSGDLRRDYSLQRQNVVDQGIGQSTQARRDIENARSALVTDLYATADPAAAAAGAQARARIATQQPEFSPLGMLFQNVAGGLADYAEGRAFNRAFAAGAGGNYSTGGGAGSGRVVGG